MTALVGRPPRGSRDVVRHGQVRRRKKAAEGRTLAIDIGGTAVKAAVIDEGGALLTDRLRIPTPVGAPPAATIREIARLVEAFPRFDRVSVGFPGAVADGRVLTAPNLHHRRWLGFDLARALSRRLRRPVRVSNDAALQGLGAIEGKGVELVVTLGTGVGSALFVEGLLVPQFTLGHHPLKKGKRETYDDRLNDEALARLGSKRWSRRLRRAIRSLRDLVAYRRLYLGGGNARKIRGALDRRTTVVPNEAGLRGGAVLWHRSNGRHR